jgi:hypothetical protein
MWKEDWINRYKLKRLEKEDRQDKSTSSENINSDIMDI